MDDRVRRANDRPFRPGAQYVLYWAQMNRRVECNHALAFAAREANRLGLPLLVYESVTCSYPFANDRLHTFLLEGVPDTAAALAERGVGYCFYLRRTRRDPNDVLYRLAAQAAAVVTDEYPTFVAREHNARVPARLDIPCFTVDSCGVIPMSRFEKREYAAYTIRPKIRRMLAACLQPVPEVRVERRWRLPAPEWHTAVTPAAIPGLVASCDIDHSVKPSLSFRGGSCAALRHLDHFLRHNLRRYAKDRNEPAAHATSDLSPYLHFGHIAALEVALTVRGYAEEHRLIADEYLEELIVRRELAFNYARFAEKPDCLRNLPNWALETLRKHAADPRNPVYSREEFELARTHDPLWNACQKEMLLRGKIHGYYRMYWGKKIIEWSRTCQDALETMVYLHDKCALDGRDPNTYTNILWCFGLHDRPWTERPIFGMVRYMSLEGMKRKTDIAAYLREIEHLERTGEDPFALTQVT
jgi:deoxyribodipyrimidine photo-lyase